MTDLDQLLQQIRQFTQDRDWGKHHKPKDLTLKLMEEVGELAEHFQWKSDTELAQHFQEPANKRAAGEEAIDVLIVLLMIMDYLKLDVKQAFLAKMKKNGQKYPVKAD